MVQQKKEKKMLWYGNIILVKFLYHAYHILNTKDCDKTCYELWKKKEPHLKYFKVWGCLAMVTYLLIKKSWLYIIKWMNIYLTVLPSNVILFVFFLVMTICPISWDDWMIF